MGGLYNTLFGYNPACVFLLPLLGRKAEEYPRFRDCFLSDDGERILIYTRVGGNNRNSGYGEEELYKDPLFVTTYDDDFDETYGTYEFNVPEKWREDFEKVKEFKYTEVSDEYVDLLIEHYPKMEEEIRKKLRG